MPINSKDEKPEIRDLIPLSKASEISGLTQPHLALLIRRGELWGTKLGGRNWFTTREAVLRYLETSPKPGPRPKSK